MELETFRIEAPEEGAAPRSDSPMPATDPSTVKISASPSINYAVVIGIIGALGSGVWFFATQTAVNQGIAERQVRFETAAGARIDADEKRNESRDTEISAMDNRLARIEAQLTFLVANGARK